MLNPRHALGARAEAATAAWLTTRGWSVLARRWRCAHGELDLVALDPQGVLVAIEVKLRSTDHSGTPWASVDGRRLRRLRSALGCFVAEAHGLVREGIRVDLVAVRPAENGQWRLTHHRAIDAW